MYRLNCNLSDDIGKRLNDYADRTGISRVNIVSLALDHYLTQEEVKLRIMNELTDTKKLAEIYKVLGVPVCQDD